MPTIARNRAHFAVSDKCALVTGSTFNENSDVLVIDSILVGFGSTKFSFTSPCYQIYKERIMNRSLFLIYFNKPLQTIPVAPKACQ